MEEMDDIQSDINDSAEHQQQQSERRRMEDGWQWWPSYHDSVIARQRAEMAQLKALSWALGRIFDDHQ